MGSKANGTNPRALGTNPRALKVNPRRTGDNPRIKFVWPQYWHHDTQSYKSVPNERVRVSTT